MTRRALDRLAAGGRKAYAEALAGLPEGASAAWRERLAGDAVVRPPANAEGLRRFLEVEVLPWYAGRRRELAERALVVERGFGAAAEARALERLGRYEVHLDRKLERTLAMLLRLRQLRGTPDAG